MNQRSSLRTLVLLPLLLFSFSTRAQWAEETVLVAGLNALELPSSMASLDANGDGWTDVIVADQERGCILLLNEEEKIFSNQLVASEPWNEVAAGNINGDGFSDIVGKLVDGNAIAVGLNDGTGNFALTTIDGPSEIVGGLRLTDLDNDADLDLVFGTGNGIYWMENEGGVFVGGEALFELTEQELPVAFDLGDVNSNGLVDIVWAASEEETYGWHSNTGNGFSMEASVVADNVKGIRLMNVDEDDAPEFIIATDEAIFVLENTDGSLGEELFMYATTTASLAVSDTDVDGDDDLLVGRTSGELLSFENTTDTSINQPVVWLQKGAEIQQLLVVDLDNDGAPDVCAITSKNPTIDVLYADGDYFTLTTGLYQQGAIDVGDLNGDGAVDMVLSSPMYWWGNCSWIFFNDGNGNYPYRTPLNIFYDNCDLNDADGDGDLDIFALDYSLIPFDTDQSIVLLENDGVGNFESHEFPDGHAFKTVGDVDGDGDTDVLTQVAGELILHEQENFDCPESYLLSNLQISGGQRYNLGDFNADGLLDVVFYDQLTGQIEVRFNMGNLTFNESVILDENIPAELISISAVDVNTDGVEDVVFSSQMANGLVAYISTGDGAFAPNTILIDYGTTIESAEFIDFDYNGFIDRKINYLDGSVAILFNDGANNYTVGFEYENPQYQGYSRVITDADADGDRDYFYIDTETNDVMLLTSDLGINVGNSRAKPFILNVYPNPVQDVLTVEFNESSPHTIELYSSEGKLVYNETTSNSTFRIDMSDYASGVYTLRVVGLGSVRVVR